MLRLAQGLGSLEQGLNAAAGPRGAELEIIESGTALPGFAGTVIGSLLAVTGIVFFMLTVYGGFVWMTARGNTEFIEKGKKTIIAAVIGMVIVMLSYAITTFVLRSTAQETPVQTPASDDGGSIGRCTPVYSIACSGASEGVCGSISDCVWESGACIRAAARGCGSFDNNPAGCDGESACQFSDLL